MDNRKVNEIHGYLASTNISLTLTGEWKDDGVDFPAEFSPRENNTRILRFKKKTSIFHDTIELERKSRNERLFFPFLPPPKKKSELMKRVLDENWNRTEGRCLSWKRSGARKHAQPCAQARCMCIRVIDDTRRRATGPLVK